MTRKKKMIPFNSDCAINILAKLDGAPQQIAKACAKDFNIPYKQFGIQLDGMANKEYGLIFPYSSAPYQINKTFSEIITNENVEVELVMTIAGKFFLEKQRKKSMKGQL